MPSSAAPRIAHLTTVHDARDVRIFYKEARSLARAGLDVTLIAPHDRDECVDGVRVRSIRPSRNRLERFTVTQARMLVAALRANAAIYHFHDPEIIPIGIFLRVLGKLVVYDVHEDLPRQVRQKAWIKPAIRKIVAIGAELVERGAARALSGIVTVTGGIAARFPAEKTVLVQNFPLSEEIAVPHVAARAPATHRAVYAGGIRLQRGARTMIEALGLLPSDSAIRMVLAGDMAPAGLLDDLKSLQGWCRVDHVGLRERSEIQEYFRGASMGLVLFHPLPNHINAQPNKLFEYMAAGLPVVASDFPLWREIVGGAECGLLVDPEDPRAIAEAMLWIDRHPAESRAMGARGREAVTTRFNWDSQADALLEFYRRLMPSGFRDSAHANSDSGVTRNPIAVASETN